VKKNNGKVAGVQAQGYNPTRKANTNKQAFSQKPKEPEDLSSLIEPELQVPPPRPMVWVVAEVSQHKITDDIRYLLERGIAARAWVTKCVSSWEGGPEAGPVYDVWYCYESAQGLMYGEFHAAFDGLHLAYGSPDYDSWLSRSFRRGGTFTVVYRGSNPEKCVIYGNLGLFIRKSLVKAAKELECCRKLEYIDTLAREFLTIAVGPLGAIRDGWEAYFYLMKKMGLMKEGGVQSFNENLKIVKKIILQGKYDESVLKRLAEICMKYTPGIWAAK
jgi:hypothetical protein